MYLVVEVTIVECITLQVNICHAFKILSIQGVSFSSIDDCGKGS